MISSWALDAEVRVRQGCYRSTPSGEEAKGTVEGRREVTGRVFSTLLVLRELLRVLICPGDGAGGWGGGAGKAICLQDPPRNNGRHSHGLRHQLCTVLSLATALKPVHVCPRPASSRASLPPVCPPSPSRTRPQAGLSTPRADLAPLRLTTRPWLPSTAGQVRPLSLAVQAPLICPLHPLQHHSRYVCPRTLHSNRQTLLLQVGP